MGGQKEEVGKKRWTVRKKRWAMRIINQVGIGIAVLSAMVAVAAYGQKDTASKADTVVDANGNLHVPDDYRTIYQFLGSWAVAADQGKGSKELHDVYASPGTIAAYRREGRFPDGAVLVKEVFEAATGEMTTGTVSHAQTLKGWFVMMRDDNNRHPGNKLWGDGWGWSWFNSDNPLKTTSTDFKIDCQPCHVPAKASDWIYTSGYAPLRR